MSRAVHTRKGRCKSERPPHTSFQLRARFAAASPGRRGWVSEWCSAWVVVRARSALTSSLSSGSLNLSALVFQSSPENRAKFAERLIASFEALSIP